MVETLRISAGENDITEYRCLLHASAPNMLKNNSIKHVTCKTLPQVKDLHDHKAERIKILNRLSSLPPASCTKKPLWQDK